MLWAVCLILSAFWLFGVVSTFSAGGPANILLVMLVIVLLANVVDGRRTPETARHLPDDGGAGPLGQ